MLRQIPLLLMLLQPFAATIPVIIAQLPLKEVTDPVFTTGKESTTLPTASCTFINTRLSPALESVTYEPVDCSACFSAATVR